MAKFMLTCSSTADMPRAYFQRRGIPFICYHYIVKDQEYPDDLGQTISSDDFYRMIRQGAMPTTTQVNAEAFVEFFEPLLKDGLDVLHIEMSSGISGTCASSMAAQRELASRYPERTLAVVDSLGASSGFGLLVDAAADLRDAGESLQTAHVWVEANKLTVQHWVYSTDLTHLRRGGRITMASATIGSLLHICPVIRVNVEGKLIPLGRTRGKKNAMAELVKCMERYAQGGAGYAGRCFVSHSACPEDARLLAAQVSKAFPHLDGDVMINDIGTVIGSHTGPGTVALFFFGEPRVD